MSTEILVLSNMLAALKQRRERTVRLRDEAIANANSAQGRVNELDELITSYEATVATLTAQQSADPKSTAEDKHDPNADASSKPI